MLKSYRPISNLTFMRYMLLYAAFRGKADYGYLTSEWSLRDHLPHVGGESRFVTAWNTCTARLYMYIWSCRL